MGSDRYGIGTALHESTCYLGNVNDKEAIFFFVNAMKTMGYSNLLILENLIFTFE
jgi:hypothetical protein